jgi:hypothetical protein
MLDALRIKTCSFTLSVLTKYSTSYHTTILYHPIDSEQDDHLLSQLHVADRTSQRLCYRTKHSINSVHSLELPRRYPSFVLIRPPPQCPTPSRDPQEPHEMAMAAGDDLPCQN